MTPLQRPHPSEERAVLQSVLYAALFDYPLTPAQLAVSLIGARADEPTVMRWFNSSVYLRERLEYADGYLFPRGRHDLVRTRARRQVTSAALLADLSGPLTLLTRMPFVRMVALSGSLAHLNADPDADLDLFVITRARRVWTTTVLVLAIARLLGWRKRLCLNYVISERALWIAPADLFSANQIVHLRPLTGERTYRRFLKANRFIERFYPNFVPRAIEKPEMQPRYVESLLNYTVGPVLEPVCRVLYQSHLRRRAHLWTSRDQVRMEPECLKLHTQSHRRAVMERFERALEDAAGVDRDDATALTREESPRLQVSL